MSRDGKLLTRTAVLLTAASEAREEDPQRWIEEAAMALQVLADSGKWSADNALTAHLNREDRRGGAAIDLLLAVMEPGMWLESRLKFAPPGHYQGPQ